MCDGRTRRGKLGGERGSEDMVGWTRGRIGVARWR